MLTSRIDCLFFASFDHRYDADSFSFLLYLYLLATEFVLPEYNLTWPKGYMILVQVTIQLCLLICIFKRR